MAQNVVEQRGNKAPTSKKLLKSPFLKEGVPGIRNLLSSKCHGQFRLFDSFGGSACLTGATLAD